MKTIVNPTAKVGLRRASPMGQPNNADAGLIEISVIV